MNGSSQLAISQELNSKLPAANCQLPAANNQLHRSKEPTLNVISTNEVEGRDYFSSFTVPEPATLESIEGFPR